jgi:hypothetical protein
MTAIFAVAVLAFSASVAGAFSLRAPQVAFVTAPLQGNLTAWDGFITAGTDQIDAQTFTTGISGNADFTMLLRTAAGAGAEIGVYNTSWVIGAPALYALFPPAAVAGWSAACHFTAGGSLTATLYDAAFVQQGTVSYSGVDRTHLGFYISGPGGLWYSQDGRNGPKPQILTYAGTQAGHNFGEWFECFEANPYAAASSNFTSAVLVLESVQPTPTRAGTWGALKAAYR